MAALTPTRVVSGPGYEMLYFGSVDHGDTYSSKMSAVQGVTATPNQVIDSSDALYTTVNGQTITFGCVGTTTGVKVSAIVYGRM